MSASLPNRRMLPAHGDWKQGFGRRLAIYLMGIAIGLMILGMFHRLKTNAQRSQDAAAQNDAAQTPAPDAAPGLPSDRTPSTPPGG